MEIGLIDILKTILIPSVPHRLKTLPKMTLIIILLKAFLAKTNYLKETVARNFATSRSSVGGVYSNSLRLEYESAVGPKETFFLFIMTAFKQEYYRSSCSN
jgi:hypothetical protein